MAESRKGRIVGRAMLVLAAVATCLLLIAVVAAPRIGTYAVAVHQRSTTQELAQWAHEYRTLGDVSEAGRAVDMLEYIPTYYVPQDGYHSDSATEAALERQRAETIAAIIDGLRDFSGEDYGKDVAQWRTWQARHSRVK